MLFLAVLVVATTIAWAVGRHRVTGRDHVRRGLGAAMVVAGLSHLVQPVPFIQHLPEWVPMRELTIAVTGVVEIVFGALLFAAARIRARVGQALAAYLVAVFPANVYVAVAGIDVQGQPDGLYPWLRLPLQALFVFLALWSTRRAAVAENGARLETAPTPARPLP
jgi:uncharacterized membrane protein